MFSLEDTNDNDFDLFWSVFPRREGKKKAQVSWNRLSKTKRQKAIFDLTKRYEGIQKCFVPHPATYLNQERWEDDPIPREENKPVEHVSSDDFIRSEITRKKAAKPKTSKHETNDGIDFLQQMMDMTR